MLILFEFQANNSQTRKCTKKNNVALASASINFTFKYGEDSPIKSLEMFLTLVSLFHLKRLLSQLRRFRYLFLILFCFKLILGLSCRIIYIFIYMQMCRIHFSNYFLKNLILMVTRIQVKMKSSFVSMLSYIWLFANTLSYLCTCSANHENYRYKFCFLL